MDTVLARRPACVCKHLYVIVAVVVVSPMLQLGIRVVMDVVVRTLDVQVILVSDAVAFVVGLIGAVGPWWRQQAVIHDELIIVVFVRLHIQVLPPVEELNDPSVTVELDHVKIGP